MNRLLKTIRVSWITPHLTLVTLDRPKNSNAFNTQMARDLINTFEELSSKAGSCRAIVITGAGSKAFSAGGDLKERLGMTESKWNKQHIVFEKMIRSIINCPIPIIGAINGAAFGGGCELVASFDFSYASRTAIFAQTETSLGIIPGIGGTQNLARAVGERRAKELIFSAKSFSAEQALEWGLVNKIFPQKNLLNETIKIASKIAENAPIAVKQAKNAIHNGLQLPLDLGMELELKCYNKTVPTEDRAEGILAFNEKRKPNFRGK